MTATLNYSGTLVVLTCWCGMRHAVPEELRKQQVRQHDNGHADVIGIYCPLGHSHVPAGKSKAAKLADELKWERDRAARANARADQVEASARAHKGAATKARKRAAAALCPCCNRSLVQLRRHMAAKHPDYQPENPT